MDRIIDVSVDYSADAKAFYEAGVRIVMRYFAKATARKGKALSLGELQRWHAAGIAVGAIYEDRGGDGGHFEDFGAANGARDATRALAMAAEVGWPKNAGIYAAVDGDYRKGQTETPAFRAIRTYFEAFAAPIRQAGYRVGAYGCGDVTDMLKARGLADLVWLSGAMGWGGSRAARDAGRYDLLQAPTKNGKIGDVAVSYDPNTAKATDFGQFAPGGAPAPALPAPVVPGFGRTLRHGDTGPEVKRLQHILHLKEDSDFGDITEAGVLGYQVGAGLDVDGVVGKATGPSIISKEKKS